MVPRFALLPIALFASLAGRADAAPQLVQAGQGWVAFDRGSLCEAMSRSLRVAAKGKMQAVASVAFTADRSRWGEFRARLSRQPRAGSNVMLVIGNQSFMLLSQGNFAWSRGPLQEQAIVNALRVGPSMRLDARDGSGRRFSDPYRTDGAPTAIDAAAARCAGKSQQG